MFIRRAKTRTTQSGADYFSYRLVESARDGAKVRQRTLLNLGSSFLVPEADWPALCQRVESLLSKQGELVDHDLSMQAETEAQRIADQLLARRSEAETSGAKSSQAGPAKRADFHSVDVDSLELVRPRSVGVEHVGLWAIEQVGLPTLLARLGLGAKRRAAALGSIIGRMAAPGSERATQRWLAGRSALGELLGEDFEAMGAIRLYHASDALMANRAEIEAHLFDRAMGLFDLKPTIALYDLTNTYFEGEVGRQPLAKRGHSKEKRSDCPLLTLGLVLDACGFARRSRVFAGNVREHGTLEEILDALGAPQGTLVVVDRGIAAEDRLTWLRDNGYRYLAVSRERQRRFDDAVDVQRIDAKSGHGIRRYKELSEDGAEARLICFSERRAEKERAMAELLCGRFEVELAKLSEGLGKPHTQKRLDRVVERVGRLRQRRQRVNRFYDVDVVADEAGERAVAVRWGKRPGEVGLATHPGVYRLRTNETDWDPERLWRTYTRLTDIEAVFRSLKSELGLHPVYHSKPERAEGHLFITVIAYQLVQVIRRRLAGEGMNMSWATVRSILAGQQRVTASFRRKDGRCLHVRKATQAEGPQREIYRALGIDEAPGGVRKTVV